MREIISLVVILLALVGQVSAQSNAPAAFGPTPNERQMKYMREPLAAFIHYGMNTYTGTDGIEWGNQVKQPTVVFNPTKSKVNTDQWVRLFKEAGFTRIIMVMKHHDGFCTWPTKQTDYNISNSPYQNGEGDLAKELSASCDKYGMDMGVYLSPWDAHEPAYGDSSPGDYNDMYDAQLRELLGGKYGRTNPKTGKREIIEIWMDGATGTVDPQTYDLNRFHATVRELQPNCLVWMDAKWHFDQKGVRTNFNLDAMWVGNEAGYINDPAWNTIDLTKLNNGQQGRVAGGNIFSVSEADVSIRPGWFYHKSQDGSVKTAKQIFDNLYARSVGMGIPLLLNIPPNRAGEFYAADSAALIDFGKILKSTFSNNLLKSSMNVTASAVRGVGFEAVNVLDNDYDTYWTMADGQTVGSLTIDLGKDTEFDIVKIQEYIPLGQRISGFKVEVETYGNWMEFASGQTIGFERMVKGALVKARKIRFTITSSLAVPLINNISVFRSDSAITTTGVVPSGIQTLNGNSKLNGWKNLANYGKYGAALKSETNSSKIEIVQTNGWIRIIGTKSPTSGIMEVWTNGKQATIVDLFSTEETKGQVLFELPNTSKKMQVEIRATGTKNMASKGSEVIIEAVLTLAKGVDAIFEVSKTSEKIDEGINNYIFEVKRLGNLKKKMKVTAVTAPGTGVHGKTYIDKTQTFTFKRKQNRKTGIVEIVDNRNKDGEKDFYIELNHPSKNTIIGVSASSRIIVKDND